MPHGFRGDGTITAGQRHQLFDDPYGQRHLGGRAGEGDEIAADMNISGQQVLELTQIRIGRTEEREHRLRREFDTGTDSACRGPGSSVVGRGGILIADIAL